MIRTSVQILHDQVLPPLPSGLPHILNTLGLGTILFSYKFLSIYVTIHPKPQISAQGFPRRILDHLFHFFKPRFVFFPAIKLPYSYKPVCIYVTAYQISNFCSLVRASTNASPFLLGPRSRGLYLRTKPLKKSTRQNISLTVPGHTFRNFVQPIDNRIMVDHVNGGGGDNINPNKLDLTLKLWKLWTMLLYLILVLYQVLVPRLCLELHKNRIFLCNALLFTYFM